MTPSISIILPIYNVEKYLQQCLESIVGQSLCTIEIICVDDGATDSSGSTIDHFASQDDRIRAIHKQNSGYGASINAGLSQATGEYIGIIEPDDYVDTTMFEKLWGAARANGNPDIVKAAYWRVCNPDTEQETILPANYLHCIKTVNAPFVLADDAEFLFHHPSIWTGIYRRDFLQSNAITMKEIPGAGWADNPFLIETLTSAQSIVYVDEPLYFYREFNLGSSSNVKDPSIIYDRWLDMDDIIRAKAITAPKIIEAHFNRGCAYIEMLNLDFDTTAPAIHSAIKSMIKRMDYNTILESKKISQTYKDAYQLHVSAPKRFFYHLKRGLTP
ncbi:MAG: glycosyltransferase [Raoultibacter sp.]